LSRLPRWRKDRSADWNLPGAAHRLRFDATSRYLFTGNGNGTIYVLRLAPPPIAQPRP
jgi:hypothetical protein